MTLKSEEDKIRAYIRAEKPFVIGINFVPLLYDCDCYFFVNAARYQYARDTSGQVMDKKTVVITSNIRNTAHGEKIVNFNLLAKLGWRFFDNSAIMCLRLLSKLGIRNIAFAGFDGFPVDVDETFYANHILQADLSPELKRGINADVCSMLKDFRACDKGQTRIKFITSSMYSGE